MKLFDKFNKKETNKINTQGWDTINPAKYISS